MLFVPNNPDKFNESICENCGEETYSYVGELRYTFKVWFHKDESGTCANENCKNEYLIGREDFDFMEELKSL